jgi:hypothetical protein
MENLNFTTISGTNVYTYEELNYILASLNAKNVYYIEGSEFITFIRLDIANLLLIDLKLSYNRKLFELFTFQLDPSNVFKIKLVHNELATEHDINQALVDVGYIHTPLESLESVYMTMYVNTSLLSRKNPSSNIFYDDTLLINKKVFNNIKNFNIFQEDINIINNKSSSLTNNINNTHKNFNIFQEDINIYYNKGSSLTNNISNTHKTSYVINNNDVLPLYTNKIKMENIVGLTSALSNISSTVYITNSTLLSTLNLSTASFINSTFVSNFTYDKNTIDSKDSTKVDSGTLNNYPTLTYLASQLASYATISYVTTQLSGKVDTGTLNNYATLTYLSSQLANYATTSALATKQDITSNFNISIR